MFWDDIDYTYPVEAEEHLSWFVFSISSYAVTARIAVRIDIKFNCRVSLRSRILDNCYT